MCVQDIDEYMGGYINNCCDKNQEKNLERDICDKLLKKKKFELFEIIHTIQNKKNIWIYTTCEKDVIEMIEERLEF